MIIHTILYPAIIMFCASFEAYIQETVAGSEFKTKHSRNFKKVPKSEFLSFIYVSLSVFVTFLITAVFSTAFAQTSVKNAVMDCSASPNDSSDDDARAINSCIASISSSGGGMVHVPAGNYHIKSVIQLRDNVTLSGESRDATIIIRSGDDAAFHMVEAERKSNVVVWNITLNGNTEVPTDPADKCAGHGIRISETNNVTIQDVIVRDTGGYGIGVQWERATKNDTSYLTISDVEISGASDTSCDDPHDGIDIKRGSRVFLSNINSHDNADKGIDIRGKYITATNLIAYGNATAGMAFVSYSTATNHPARGSLSNLVSYGNSGDGILLGNVDNVLDNVIDGDIKPSALSVTSLTTYANGKSGIVIGGSHTDLALSGLQVSNNSRDGISFISVGPGLYPTVNIAAATVRGNGNRGMKANIYGYRISVTGSQFVQNGSDGVYASKSGFTLLGCQLSANKGYGFNNGGADKSQIIVGNYASGNRLGEIRKPGGLKAVHANNIP
jgi:hypothetical protein